MHNFRLIVTMKELKLLTENLKSLNLHYHQDIVKYFKVWTHLVSYY